MGMQFSGKGLDGSAVQLGFVPPVLGNLEYFNYFGDTASKTARNLVTGKAQGTVVGTPIVNAGYVTLGANANYVVTGLLDQAEITIMAVCRPTPGDGAKFRYVFGNYNGSGIPGGSNFYFDNATVAKPVAGGSRTVSGTDTFSTTYLNAETDTSGWAFYMVRIGAAFHRIDDKTRGLSAIGAVTSPRSSTSGLPYRIGDDSTSVSTGQTDISWIGAYSRCITDAEGTKSYLAVQAVMANKATPILI